MKTKHSGKSSGKFGKKVIENSGKSNGNFRKKQWEIRAKGIIFARNNFYMLPFSEFSHCLVSEFPLLLPEFPIAFPEISGKSNWKFWQKQSTNLGKSNEKTRKALGYIFRAKNTEVLGNFTDWSIIFKIYFLDQIEIYSESVYFGPLKVREKKCLSNGKSFVELENYVALWLH